MKQVVRSLAKSSLLTKTDVSTVWAEQAALWERHPSAQKAVVFRNAFAHAGGGIDEETRFALNAIEADSAPEVGKLLTLSKQETLEMVNDIISYAHELANIVNGHVREAERG